MDQLLESFDLDVFYRLFINGWVVDGRSGGLITGRTHETGHILMYLPSGDPVTFSRCGVVAGGEFIASTQATEHHFERLQKINSDKSPCDQVIRTTPESRIINARAEPHDKLLIIYKQYIINAEATKRHFEELEEINASCQATTGILFNDQQAAIIAKIEITPPTQ